MKSSLGFTKTEICELMRDWIPYTTKDVAESGLPEDFKQFLFDARDQICEFRKSIATDLQQKAGIELIPEFMYNWDLWTKEAQHEYKGWRFFK